MGGGGWRVNGGGGEGGGEAAGGWQQKRRVPCEVTLQDYGYPWDWKGSGEGLSQALEAMEVLELGLLRGLMGRAAHHGRRE